MLPLIENPRLRGIPAWILVTRTAITGSKT